MYLLIDRQARDALYEACASEIEGVSDLRIAEGDAGRVRDLWRKLKAAGPLLDQIGWEPETDLGVFGVDLNVRRTRSFLRRQIDVQQRMLQELVTTEAQLDHELAVLARHTGESTSEEERAWQLADMRARVDVDLDHLAAFRRLLNVLNGASLLDAIEKVA